MDKLTKPEGLQGWSSAFERALTEELTTPPLLEIDPNNCKEVWIPSELKEKRHKAHARSWLEKYQAKNRLGARLMRLGEEVISNQITLRGSTGESDQYEIGRYLQKLGYRIRCCRTKIPYKPKTYVLGGECSEGHKHVTGPYRCKSPWCDLCREERSRENQINLHHVLNEAYRRIDRGVELLHVVLTVRHGVGDSAKERKAHMQKSWHKLKNRKFWKDRVIGASKHLECHLKTKGPHPHFHILAMVETSGEIGHNKKYLEAQGWDRLLEIARGMSWWRQIPRRIRKDKYGDERNRKELIAALSQAHKGIPVQVLIWEWYACTGDSWRIWITDKSWGKQAQTVGEAAKYVSKGDLADPKKIKDWQLVDMVHAFKNTRTFDFHGLFKDIARELKLEEEEESEGEEQVQEQDKHTCPDCGRHVDMMKLANAEEWLAGDAPVEWDDLEVEPKPPDIKGRTKSSNVTCLHQGTLLLH